jgi:hypothetical protein
MVALFKGDPSRVFASIHYATFLPLPPGETSMGVRPLSGAGFF